MSTDVAMDASSKSGEITTHSTAQVPTQGTGDAAPQVGGAASVDAKEKPKKTRGAKPGVKPKGGKGGASAKVVRTKQENITRSVSKPAVQRFFEKYKNFRLSNNAIGKVRTLTEFKTMIAINLIKQTMEQMKNKHYDLNGNELPEETSDSGQTIHLIHVKKMLEAHFPRQKVFRS
jgi:hypothetical protein